MKSYLALAKVYSHLWKKECEKGKSCLSIIVKIILNSDTPHFDLRWKGLRELHESPQATRKETRLYLVLPHLHKLYLFVVIAIIQHNIILHKQERLLKTQTSAL